MGLRCRGWFEFVTEKQIETRIKNPRNETGKNEEFLNDVARCKIQSCIQKFLIVFLVEALLGFVEGHVREGACKGKKRETAEK